MITPITTPPTTSSTATTGTHDLGTGEGASTTIRNLVIIAAVFTLFDAAATWSWLQLGLAEGNPIVRTAIDLYGPTSGMLMRAVWGLALVLGLSRLAGRSRFAWSALLGVALSMAIVGMVHVAGGTAAFMAAL